MLLEASPVSRLQQANSLWLKMYAQWRLVPVYLTHTNHYISQPENVSAASWTCEVEQNGDRLLLILLPMLLQLVKHHCLSHGRSQTWLWRNVLSPGIITSPGKINKPLQSETGTATVTGSHISQRKEMHAFSPAVYKLLIFTIFKLIPQWTRL